MVEIIFILLAPIVGGLLYGIERIVKARMQNRQGPPLLQPFYDTFKLMDKQALLVNPYHAILGFLHFVSLWIVVAFIVYGENLLYVIFLHLLSSVFIVLAGFSVKSVYSHIGANRELMTIVAYEPILIMMAVGFYASGGSFEISTIRTEPSQILPLALVFIAFLLVMPIKLKKSPFDAAEAHQEIVGGVELEYSGIFYEFVYMAKWLEYVFIYLLLTLFAGDSIVFASVLMFSVFLLLNLVDNASARVRVQELVKIVIGVGLTLSLVNIIGLSYV